MANKRSGFPALPENEGWETVRALAWTQIVRVYMHVLFVPIF